MSNEATNDGVVGVGLLVAAYVDERGADNALEQLKQAKKTDQFFYDDAAVVRRSAEDKVHVKETGDMSTGKGAGIGALIGGVIGLVAGPVGWAALGGAAIGALAAHHDAGFDKDSLEEIGGALPSGTSSLLVTTSKDFVEAVRKESTEEETLTRAREIATQINDHLNMRQDVLMAMLLTEEGIAAGKVVSAPGELAVFGIAATEEGVVVGAAVATPEGAAAVEAVATPVEEGEEEAAEEAEEEAEETADS